jgi:hypothetical protein
MSICEPDEQIITLSPPGRGHAGGAIMKPLRDQNPAGLRAGAAVTDLTPAGSVFLFGYPHVPRWSTGVHDPLECAALYLRDGWGGRRSSSPTT